MKNFRSFGGKDVRILGTKTKISKNDFFQKFETGESISVQFFSDEKKTKILSILDQIQSKDTKNPFLIETILTRKVNDFELRKMQRIVKKISKIFRLRGVNNIDLISKKNNFSDLKLLELNARPGLSTNIIHKTNKKVFDDYNFDVKFKNPTFFFSTTIIYSKKKVLIDKKKISFIKKLSKSKNFSELPSLQDQINLDEPICLLHLKSKKREIIIKKISRLAKRIHKSLSCER